MNSLDLDGPGLDRDRVFFRSLATRGAHELPGHLADVIAATQAAGFDLVVVETPGIGQGDAAVVPFVDTSLYVMTPEYGAASQLEKIDMLDFADAVAINKFERRGAKDALREVARQLVRNREAFGQQPDDMPVFGTSAATFDDDGVTALYQFLRGQLTDHGLAVDEGQLTPVERQDLDPDPAGAAVRPGPLPRRDRRHAARLPRGDRGAGRRRPAGAALRRGRGRGAGGRGAREAGGRGPAGRRPRPARRVAGGRREATPATPGASRCRPPGSPASPYPRSTTTASWCGSGAARTCRASSRSPAASSPTSATTRTRRGCSPARATRSAPTAASSCSPRASRRPGCRRRSTR